VDENDGRPVAHIQEVQEASHWCHDSGVALFYC
jgi:hypothetical protein